MSDGLIGVLRAFEFASTPTTESMMLGSEYRTPITRLL
jgi:hypothetical protein